MFDIGFLELLLIAAVALLVIGPERLPGAVRTGAVYLRRIKRGFNDIRREVEQELHNDAVMQELKQTRDQVDEQARQLREGVSRAEQALGDDLNAATDKGREKSSGQKGPGQKGPGQEGPAQEKPSQEDPGGEDSPATPPEKPRE